MNKTANIQNIKTTDDAGDQTGINWQYVLQGTLTVLAFLAMIAFWGIFIYSMVSGNVKLALIFGQIIAIGAGVFGTLHFLSKLVKGISEKSK